MDNDVRIRLILTRNYLVGLLAMSSVREDAQLTTDLSYILLKTNQVLSRYQPRLLDSPRHENLLVSR